MKQQRPRNQAIDHLNDIYNLSVQDEELRIQRRSEQITKWTLYVAVGTLLVSIATLIVTIFIR